MSKTVILLTFNLGKLFGESSILPLSGQVPHPHQGQKAQITNIDYSWMEKMELFSIIL